MPPRSGDREGLTSMIGRQEAKAIVIVHPKTVLDPNLRARHDVRPEPSKPDCKGYKLRGLDTGPCGSKLVNCTSNFFIICVIAALCFAGFMNWKHAWAKAAADRRTHERRRRNSNQRSQRRKRALHENTIRQSLHIERVRWNSLARRLRMSVNCKIKSPNIWLNFRFDFNLLLNNDDYEIPKHQHEEARYAHPRLLL
ncbi:MAG: hypothetical protein Q9166_006641 [cf. Caloplaca sp. 2 TL-2023]